MPKVPSHESKGTEITPCHCGWHHKRLILVLMFGKNFVLDTWLLWNSDLADQLVGKEKYSILKYSLGRPTL
jgi:hypothetical protein